MNRKQHIIQVPDVKKVGVYAIYNKFNDKYYVGSSVNINSRMKSHRSNIEKLNGSNLKMDEDLKSENDIKNFEFIVLETFEDFEITDLELRNREAFYINKYDAYNGYNVSSRPPTINGYFGDNEFLRAEKMSYKNRYCCKDITKMSNASLLQRYSKMLCTDQKRENEIFWMKHEILKRMVTRYELEKGENMEDMTMTEIARLIEGLRSAGWEEKKINDFLLYIESGSEEFKPKEEK